MERIDAYLTRQIQTVLPAATVRVQRNHSSIASEPEVWFVEKGECNRIIGLGSSFKEARSAIAVLIKAVEERRKIGVPEDKLIQWGDM